ncbi:MAG: hypothetical protein HYS08_01210 [Chlamydiae bacterium]|nr:hypothetical protein [Chlamydiota bacterium]MBI3266860.1 hypothetical protein [Chlamydiota bacterium]
MSDRLSLLLQALMALSLFFFLPGYALTRTFLSLPRDSSVMEAFSVRVLLSLLISSFLGLGMSTVSAFSREAMMLAPLFFSLVFFSLRKFRLIQYSDVFRLNWEDVFLALALMLGLILFFRPSENIAHPFIQACELAKANGWALDLQGLRASPLLSIWFGIFHLFLGLQLSLMVVPILSLISLLALFCLARRLFDRVAGICAALLLATHFCMIWFARLPEGYLLAQALGLVAFYFACLFFEEKHFLWMMFSFLSAIGAYLARLEMWVWAVFFIGAWAGMIFLRGDKSQRKYFLLLMGFVLCPLWTVFHWKGGVEAPLKDLAPFVFWALPALILWVSAFFSFAFRLGKVARVFAVGGVLVMMLLSLNVARPYLKARESDGLLRFYGSLSRSFLPDDLIFSDDEREVSLLKKLYGMKIYFVPPQGLDTDFLREIRRWLKEGGKVFLISKHEKPGMRDFKLTLCSVEHLRTGTLEGPWFSLRWKFEERTVRVYEGHPVGAEISES